MIPPTLFTDNDFTTVDLAHDDPMVITIEIDKFTITKSLVDQGGSVDILSPSLHHQTSKT